MNTISTVKERKNGKFNLITIPIILVHLITIASIFTFSWANLAAFFVMWWLVGSIGIGLGFHRQLTHRGFQSSDFFRRLLAFIGTIAWQGSPTDWVTTHRLHHQFTDTEKDPHSPRHGFYWSHVGWVTVGTGQDNNEQIEKRYIPDLLKDKFIVKLSEYWYVPSIVAGGILALIGGWTMIVWGLFLPIMLNWHFTWFVNSVTHVWGSRRFETNEDSTNNWWVAALTWGEGWHNNHHAHPVSARHGLAWYEFDINWMQIKILEKLGIVWDVKAFDLKAFEAKQKEKEAIAKAIDETPEFWQQAA